MEWAQSGEVGAGLLEADVFADNADNVRLLFDAFRE